MDKKTVEEIQRVHIDKENSEEHEEQFKYILNKTFNTHELEELTDREIWLLERVFSTIFDDN